MRKLRRNMIKAEARKRHLKESRYLKAAWQTLQTKKYGRAGRASNIMKGTEPKRKWSARLADINF